MRNIFQDCVYLHIILNKIDKEYAAVGFKTPFVYDKAKNTECLLFLNGRLIKRFTKTFNGDFIGLVYPWKILKVDSCMDIAVLVSNM